MERWNQREPKVGRAQRVIHFHYKKLLLLVFSIMALFSVGYGYGRKSAEVELRELSNNIYGGKYYVELTFSGSNGLKDTIKLSSVGFRFPMRNLDGEEYIKTTIPFIERKEVPYDTSFFALTNGITADGFDFTLIDCPIPDRILVQRWRKEQQGTSGNLMNGEIVNFESTSQPTRFHVSEFETEYIYSILASWGPYYGEYACLVSDRADERVYWKLNT